MKRIIALRHAESIKNLEDIYGGNGKELTKKGLDSIKDLNYRLQKEYDIKNQNNIKLYTSCNRVHVVETCKKIAKYIGINDVYTDELYSPINLGAFNGLSKDEQKKIYPEAFKALEKWNLGIGDINDFVVDGLETALHHSQRIKTFLSDIEDEMFYILIGTRSDLSAIKNIALGNRPDVYMEYKYYSTEYLCGIYFEMVDESIFNVNFII